MLIPGPVLPAPIGAKRLARTTTKSGSSRSRIRSSRLSIPKHPLLQKLAQPDSKPPLAKVAETGCNSGPKIPRELSDLKNRLFYIRRSKRCHVPKFSHLFGGTPFACTLWRTWWMPNRQRSAAIEKKEEADMFSF